MTSNITSSKYPIGLSLPFINGNGGYFQQTFDTNSQVKTNLLNFLKTKQGERRMMPEFGTKLYTILFEQRDDNTKEIIKNIIKDEITTWIPEVTISNISIIEDENYSDDNNYKMRIYLEFTIIQTGKSDSLELELQNIKI